MKTNAILVRFAEVFLKGGRRQWFTARLKESLQRQVATAGAWRVRDRHGMFLVVHPDAKGSELPDFEVGPDLEAAITRTFGVVSFSPCRLMTREISALEDLAAGIADAHVAGRATFKVATTRADKEYPLDSVAVNRRLGGIIHTRTGVPARMKDPEVTVHVQIQPHGAAVYLDVLPGPGGLPVGTSGRVLLLLSGGIDSPAAGYLMMRRGCTLDAVHFEAAPYTTPQAREKVEALAGMLAAYEPELTMHVVPFGGLQARLRDGAPGRLLVVLYRRFMMRIANRIAQAAGHQALVTGESLGQVASQTIENLSVIEAASALPILRPLLTYDKMEAVALARRIGTYKTSVLPHDDCCSLFVPPHPETAARLDRVLAVEADFDVEAMVDEAVAATEAIRIGG
jgi:thiamine biosynthesis protein ThiI